MTNGAGSPLSRSSSKPSRARRLSLLFRKRAGTRRSCGDGWVAVARAARLSSGQQYLSWIHADDIVEIVAQALLNPSIHGAINAVAPTPVTNAEFTKKLAVLTKSYRVPPAPAFVLRLMYGEMADLLLSSQKVKPEMLLKMKWNFKFNDIDKALSAALAAPLSK